MVKSKGKSKISILELLVGCMANFLLSTLIIVLEVFQKLTDQITIKIKMVNIEIMILAENLDKKNMVFLHGRIEDKIKKLSF